MAIYGRSRGRLRVSVIERAVRSRKIRFRMQRNRPMLQDEEAGWRAAYGIFASTDVPAGERIDPALLERALWYGLV